MGRNSNSKALDASLLLTNTYREYTNSIKGITEFLENVLLHHRFKLSRAVKDTIKSCKDDKVKYGKTKYSDLYQNKLAQIRLYVIELENLNIPLDDSKLPYSFKYDLRKAIELHKRFEACYNSSGKPVSLLFNPSSQEPCNSFIDVLEKISMLAGRCDRNGCHCKVHFVDGASKIPSLERNSVYHSNIPRGYSSEYFSHKFHSESDSKEDYWFTSQDESDDRKSIVPFESRNMSSYPPPLEKSKPLMDSQSPACMPLAGAIDENWEVELAFGAFCLFEDMHRIRSFLSKLWHDYQHNKKDGMTVSMLSNVAIDLIRRTESEFKLLYAYRVTTKDILKAVCSTSVTSAFKKYTSESRPDHFRSKMGWAKGVLKALDANIEQSEFSFLTARLALDDFILQSQPSLDPTKKYLWRKGPSDEIEVPTDPKARTALPYKESQVESIVYLLNILPEIPQESKLFESSKGSGNVGSADCYKFALDEVASAVLHSTSKKESPLWAIFATQLLLDTFHIMRDDLSAGYNDLTTYIQDSKASLTLTKNDITQIGANSPKGLNPINHLDRDISFLNWWVRSDEMNDATLQLALTEDLPSKPSPREDFYLLKRHPLLCGRICFMINMRMQITGILTAYKTGTFFNAAHLYNAALSVKSLWTHLRIFQITKRSQNGRTWNVLFPSKAVITYSSAILDLNL